VDILEPGVSCPVDELGLAFVCSSGLLEVPLIKLAEEPVEQYANDLAYDESDLSTADAIVIVAHILLMPRIK
jgi:hypothetical protein